MVVITRSTIKFYITASLLLYFRSIVYLINNINNISSYKHDRHHDPHHGIRIGTVVVSGGDRLSSLSSTSFTMTTITAEEEDDDDDGHDSDARSSSSSHIIIQQDQQHEHEHEEEQEEEDDDDDEVDEDEYYPPGEERFDDDDDDDDDQKLYQHRSLPKVFVISNPITDHWTKDGVDYLSTKLLRTYNPVEADIWIINMLETTATTATSAKNNKNDKNDDGVEEFNSNNTNTTIGYKNLTLPVSSNTFFKYVQHVHDQRVLHNITTTTPNFNSYSNSHQSSHKHLHSWKLFVMDTYDQGYKNYYNYLRKLSHIVGHFNVYYLRRAYTNHDRCIKHDKYSLSMMKLQNSICNASTTDVSKLPTVDDRNFISSTTNPSNDIPFYNLGTEFHDETEGKYHNGVTKILRLPVRTDFVHALNEILSEIQQNKVIMEKQQQHEQQEEEEEEEHSSNETTTTSASNTTISTTSSTLPTAATTLYPYDIPRIKDVVHYWPHKIKGTSISKLQASLSTHRQRISQVLYQLSHSKYYMEQYPKNTNFVNRIDVGFVGTRGKKGRQQPQYTYLRDMLQYKIVVVCQKDLWEDHYRLMESLISGSLVFTDPMIPTTLPYKLQNGTNIIVYHSIQELIQYVQYYTNPNNEYERLTIAKNGYHVAMKYHRSYHIIERMIYGNYSNKIL